MVHDDPQQRLPLLISKSYALEEEAAHVGVIQWKLCVFI